MYLITYTTYTYLVPTYHRHLPLPVLHMFVTLTLPYDRCFGVKINNRKSPGSAHSNRRQPNVGLECHKDALLN